MRFRPFLILLLCVFTGLISCNTAPEKAETVISGSATILVDNTFAPIIEDQLTVFASTYSHADITLIKGPENRVVHLLMSDSARVAIVSRRLTEQENNFFVSKDIIPKTRKFATDAVALITHKSNPDSSISVDEIVRILNGDSKTSRSLVFDNPNSSTVRFLKELAKIDSLPETGIYALNSNEEVIEFVHDNPKMIGVVGVNWLAQPSVELAPYVEELVAVKVKRSDADEEGYKPTQSNLAQGLYPLARDLFLINCQGTYGLGLGFSAFLAGERGQRLILKSGLLPDSIPSRELIIRN